MRGEHPPLEMMMGGLNDEGFAFERLGPSPEHMGDPSAPFVPHPAPCMDEAMHPSQRDLSTQGRHAIG